MDFSVKNIFFHKNHVVSPFTTEKDFGGIKLSTLEKVAAIGLSILIGSFTLLIGGVVAFYWITATIKSDKIKQLNLLQRSSVETNQDIDVEPKKTKKKKTVSFAPEPDLVKIKLYDPIRHQDQEEDGLKEIEKQVGEPEVEKFDGELSTNLGFSKKILAQFASQKSFFSGYPSSPDERRYPPLASCDTLRFKNGQLVSAHSAKIELFKKDEIIKLHSASAIHHAEGIQVDKDDKGRIVIQQQATRGCTAAAVCMLTYPKIDIHYLKTTNLGDASAMRKQIDDFGLQARVTTLDLTQTSGALLQVLKIQIEKNGSAIVSIGGEIGGHVVVVDEISDDLATVRLRDPYHGWAISVTRDAFCNRLIRGETSYMVQVSSPGP